MQNSHPGARVTVERHLVIPIGDIQAVILSCLSCPTTVHLPTENPDVKYEMIEKCPGCREIWWKSGFIKPYEQPTHASLAFLLALRTVRTIGTAQTVGFTIALKIDQP